MSGEPDPLYVRARRALLDAADALEAHLDAVVLVGAQALYLHAGEADLQDAGAPYTTDADLAIRPSGLAESPLVGVLMTRAGFTLGEHPGSWVSGDGIPVDLMVPEALAGPGSRGARLGPHGKRVARRAKGLEAALVDRERMQVRALDPSDTRRVFMYVAGAGALLVAKVHKIAERSDSADRLRDKTGWSYCRSSPDWPKPSSVDINLTASFVLGQAAARAMVAAGNGGTILYTASISGVAASTGDAHYGVSKAGIISLVKTMAIELVGHNITVNCVSPGPLDTPMSLALLGSEEAMQAARESWPIVPMNRLGSPNGERSRRVAGLGVPGW